jgi:hypothetical protein
LIGGISRGPIKLRYARYAGVAGQRCESLAGIGPFIDDDGDRYRAFGGRKHCFNDLGHVVRSKTHDDQTFTRRLHDLEKNTERLAE